MREMAFRGNFLIKVTVELLWLGILLAFYATIFGKTSSVAGWTQSEYMFFLGCYYALESLMEALFLGNCSEFGELVRTGELDFYLLQPIDEQFLISTRSVDWSSVPSFVLGCVIMLLSLLQTGWNFDPVRLALFPVLFLCGLALAYSFMLALTAASVWMVRNQSLYELWWLAMSLMRYPREVLARTWWSEPLSRFFTFIIPVMLIINLPAQTMVKALEPWLAAYAVAATALCVVLSRALFRAALRRYRSASS